MSTRFTDMDMGQTVTLFFPRGGSMTGVIIDLNYDRAIPWALISQRSGAVSSVYESDIDHFDVLLND